MIFFNFWSLKGWTGHFFKTLSVGSVPELIILRTTFFLLKFVFRHVPALYFLLSFAGVEMSTPAVVFTYYWMINELETC